MCIRTVFLQLCNFIVDSFDRTEQYSWVWSFSCMKESQSLSCRPGGDRNRGSNNTNNRCREGNLNLLLPGMVMEAFLVRITWFFLLVYSGAKASKKTSPGDCFYSRYFSVSSLKNLVLQDWLISPSLNSKYLVFTLRRTSK